MLSTNNIENVLLLNQLNYKKEFGDVTWNTSEAARGIATPFIKKTPSDKITIANEYREFLKAVNKELNGIKVLFIEYTDIDILDSEELAMFLSEFDKLEEISFPFLTSKPLREIIISAVDFAKIIELGITLKFANQHTMISVLHDVLDFLEAHGQKKYARDFEWSTGINALDKERVAAALDRYEIGRPLPDKVSQYYKREYDYYYKGDFGDAFWKKGVFTKLSAKTLRTPLKDFNQFLKNIDETNNIQELNIEYKYGLPAIEFNQFRKQFKNLKKINFPKLIPAAVRDLSTFKAIDPAPFALTELITKKSNMLLLQAEGIDNDSPTGEEYARYIALGIELNFEIRSTMGEVQSYVLGFLREYGQKEYTEIFDTSKGVNGFDKNVVAAAIHKYDEEFISQAKKLISINKGLNLLTLHRSRPSRSFITAMSLNNPFSIEKLIADKKGYKDLSPEVVERLRIFGSREFISFLSTRVAKVDASKYLNELLLEIFSTTLNSQELLEKIKTDWPKDNNMDLDNNNNNNNKSKENH